MRFRCEPSPAAAGAECAVAADCHIHTALDGADWRAAFARHRESPDETGVRAVLARYAQAGVTYLRDGGDKFGASLLAARLAPEYGIEYASPAFPLFEKGNAGGFLGRAFEGRAGFEELLEQAQAAGAAFAKLLLSGINDFTRYGAFEGHALDAPLMRFMVERAHAAGLPVMAHVNGADAVLAAACAGVDSVEHGFYLDERALDAMRETGCVWVPTFAPVAVLVGGGVYPDAVLNGMLAHHARMLRHAVERGCAVALGSDAGAGGAAHVHASQVEARSFADALGSDWRAAAAHGCGVVRERFSSHSSVSL